MDDTNVMIINKVIKLLSEMHTQFDEMYKLQTYVHKAAD